MAIYSTMAYNIFYWNERFHIKVNHPEQTDSVIHYKQLYQFNFHYFRFSRNNVLHLWPYNIHDLRALGAKKFYGKFCAGSIDHISIRQLQCILLKVCLLLGVEVFENVGFEELIEPTDPETGWRARFSPESHPLGQYEFDVIVAADGRRNTIPGFKRKEMRGKLAIAITVNFINRHTEAENHVEEIAGSSLIY